MTKSSDQVRVVLLATDIVAMPTWVAFEKRDECAGAHVGDYVSVGSGPVAVEDGEDRGCLGDFADESVMLVVFAETAQAGCGVVAGGELCGVEGCRHVAASCGGGWMWGIIVWVE